MTRFAAIFEVNRRKTLPTAIVPLNLQQIEGRERVEVFDLVGVLNKDWHGLSTNAVQPRLFVERPDSSNVQAAVRRHQCMEYIIRKNK